MKEKQILECKHEWCTESEGSMSCTYCTKCYITKKGLKDLKEINKNQKLTAFNPVTYSQINP